jgi:hypothetical protein
MSDNATLTCNEDLNFSTACPTLNSVLLHPCQPMWYEQLSRHPQYPN